MSSEEKPPGITIDLGKVRPSNATSLLLWRAQAIGDYANLEQSLCRLFAHLLGVAPEKAALIFFRITSTHARNAMLESLLKDRHEGEFNVYWYGVPSTPNNSGLMDLLRQIDSRRNEIVHWLTANTVTFDRKTNAMVSVLELVRPNFWASRSASQTISDTDMQEFCAKTNFVTRSLNMFMLVANDQLAVSPDAHATWLEICQQPCTYPPPSTHPLALKPEEPQSQPESSHQ